MLSLALLTTTLACSGPAPAPKRDWRAHPAVLVDAHAPDTLYAISDVHCGYTRMATLLAANGIIAPKPSSPASIAWTASTATLVVVGDAVDKGPECVETVDALMALQASAAKAGGRVVVTLGNHEAEFLVDPFNSKTSKSDGFATQLDLHGIKPQSVADGTDPRGLWLRNLPVAASIGSWVFVHAGFAKPTSIAQLSSSTQAAIDANGFTALTSADSVLEVRDWATTSTAPSIVTALGAQHLAVGHDPSALGPKGSIAMLGDGVVFRIDTGMSPDIGDSTGEILRIRTTSATGTTAPSVSVDALDATGAARTLWTGRP